MDISDLSKRKKRVVMQHCIESHINNGGPATGVKLLMSSELAKTYTFIPLVQRNMSNISTMAILIDLVKQIRKNKPDIVHIRGLQSPGFIGLLAALLAGCKKIVVSVHGSSIDSLALGKLKRLLYQQVIEPFTLKNASLVYCVCNYAASRPYIRNNTSNLFGYIHNAAPDFSGLDTTVKGKEVRDELDINPGEIVITFVGRMVFDKGLDDLSNAIRLLEEQSTHRVRYLFVGEGPYLSTIKSRLKELHDINRVIFLGKRSDVESILFASNIFVFPTLHENLSNSLLEACSAGLAIIATNVGGNPEVVQHKSTGLLVSPRNPVELSEAMLQLIVNPEMRRHLGKRAKENVRENFSQDLVFKRIDEAYRSIL